MCDGCTFYGHTELRADGQKSEIRIGEKTTVGSAVIHATEGSKIHIGRECMLSHEIDIRSGDGHKIFYIEDMEHRINEPKDIVIGNHVWIGKRVQCLKGTDISDNSIVGAGSLVTKELCESNVIVAGNVAKVIKKGVSWKR